MEKKKETRKSNQGVIAFTGGKKPIFLRAYRIWENPRKELGKGVGGKSSGENAEIIL